jgi:hypothetical protein
MPATYEPIATNSVTGSTASITFSSIPATYTDLRLIMNGIATSSARLTFNGIGGTNYSVTAMRASNGSLSSTRTSDTDFMAVGYPGTGMGTGQPNYIAIDIFNYKDPAFAKTILSSWSADYNSSFSVTARVCGLSKDTSAITSITFTGSFEVPATLTLFGILKA